MSITYENQNGVKRGKERRWNIDVRLGGKIVGEIVQHAEGWGYIPKGKRKPSEYHQTLYALKSHLEAE